MNKVKILIIGHRGASFITPENTLKAIQKAIELKADAVEFDVRVSKDGEFVLSHDSNTLRATGYNGHIAEMTLKELKKLDFGEGERIPTLTELISITRNKIRLIFEVLFSGFSEKFVQILEIEKIIGQTIVSSFSFNELIKIQKINKKIRLGLLLSKKITSNKMIERSIKKAINNNFYSMHLHFSAIKPQFVKFCHDNNLKVIAWTVNDVKQMKLLIQMGIDGIITDDIPLLQNVLGNN
jgi:glycerophosphoryl diester phosphodiesterase